MMSNGIEAKIIADSVSPEGVRLTTLQLRYPRFIHAEFMTHRVFSRNASSSRAIPVAKLLDQIEEQPAMPIHWGKNQAGMQAREEHDEPIKILSGIKVEKEEAWKRAGMSASLFARAFMDAGYHKQIVNRLTEPFQFINVVCTATEYDNFFTLRLHEDAQPEIHNLAMKMKEAMIMSVPNLLEAGEWHLPYVSEEEINTLNTQEAIKCSTARCARVSYLNHDKTDPSVEKDIELHDMLVTHGHMSPLEHQATPMSMLTPVGEVITLPQERMFTNAGVTHYDLSGQPWSGNFKGWVQYRQL